MKINYDISSKEYFSYLNITTGFLSEKRKWKKDRSLKTFAQISIRNYLLCFLFIPLIAFFDTFINLDNLTFFFAMCLILTLFFQTINLLLFLISCFQKTRKPMKGEIRIDEDGITERLDSGKQISRKWSGIKNILIHDDVIFIYNNRGTTFLIPNKGDNEKKVRDIVKKLEKEKLLIECYEPHGFHRHFEIWGKYLLIFLVTVGIAIYWDYYNISLIDDEIWKINNSEYKEINEEIVSYQKFGVVEKTLKEYFKEFYEAKERYYANEASMVFSKVTIDILKNNPDELNHLYDSLSSYEDEANKAAQNIIDLLTEEKVMERIRVKNLGENYENNFKDYALTKEDAIHAKSWHEELEKNRTKMKYVKRALEILTNEKECWYIEDDMLYVCDEYLDEYNRLYDLILDHKSSGEQTV